ncbi:MAG: hypothetical protein VYD19_00490 [Myxococcota bacterium]|nr:hypothetical protein [Myxococcota bacterium]
MTRGSIMLHCFLAVLSLSTLVVTESVASRAAYSISLVDASGRRLPTFYHRGERFVLGDWGERYLLRVQNQSGRRVEVVLTVDGRDVINGSPGRYQNRGYIVDPHSTLEVEGFRRSRSSVATFRFTDPSDSYAGRVGAGENVGVIGAAFFPERRRRHVRPRVRANHGALEDLASASPPPSPSIGLRGDGAAERAVPRSGSMGRRKRRRAPAGLGTRYGEERQSASEEVTFSRASRTPSRVLSLRYDNRAGLELRGIIVERPRHQPDGPSAFPSEPQFTPPPP